jgi:hypothetical protein
MDDRRVTDAFGPCLPAFVAYVVHHIVSGGRDSPASSVSHSDVFQHLTVRGALVREVSLCDALLFRQRPSLPRWRSRAAC